MICFCVRWVFICTPFCYMQICFSGILIFGVWCGKIIMPNYKIQNRRVFLPRGYYTLLRSYYEFDKNANSISMNAEMLFVLI